MFGEPIFCSLQLAQNKINITRSQKKSRSLVPGSILARSRSIPLTLIPFSLTRPTSVTTCTVHTVPLIMSRRKKEADNCRKPSRTPYSKLLAVYYVVCAWPGGTIHGTRRYAFGFWAYSDFCGV